MKIYQTSATFFFVIVLFLMGCKAEGQETLNVDAFKDTIQSADMQLVDIRTAEEYETGFIKGFKNVDFLQANFLDQMGKFDKNKPLAIYCKVGGRTKKAMKQLSEAGFKNIYALEGGLDAWQKEGQPIAMPKPVVEIIPEKLNYSVAEFNQLIASDSLVFIEFTAVWCGPCKLLKPIIEKLTDDYSNKKVRIVKIDVDQSKALANEMLVNEIPLILLYKNGELLERLLGFTPERILKETIDKYL